MFSKTSLIKGMAIALGLNVVASTASAYCLLVAADGEFITLPRGGCFYGATEQQFAEFGGLGCENASQVFYIPEFNDRAVAIVMTHGLQGYGGRLNLHADNSQFGGGGAGGYTNQVFSMELTGEQRENISAFRCG